MADPSDPPFSPGTEFPAGCSLGCAAWFLLFSVLWPVGLILSHEYEGGLVPPFFIGLPAFVLGNILALFGVFSRHRPSRKRAILALILMWVPVLAALLFLGVGSLLGW